MNNYLIKEIDLKNLSVFLKKICDEVNKKYSCLSIQIDYADPKLLHKSTIDMLSVLFSINPASDDAAMFLLHFIHPFLFTLNTYPCKKTVAELIEKYTFFPYINENYTFVHYRMVSVLIDGATKNKIFEHNKDILYRIKAYAFFPDISYNIHHEKQLEQLEIIFEKLFGTLTERYLTAAQNIFGLAALDFGTPSSTLLRWHILWMNNFNSWNQDYSFNAAKLLCKCSTDLILLLKSSCPPQEELKKFYLSGIKILEHFLNFLAKQNTFPPEDRGSILPRDMFSKAVALLVSLEKKLEEKEEILSYSEKIFAYFEPWHYCNLSSTPKNQYEYLDYIENYFQTFNPTLMGFKEICLQKPELQNKILKISLENISILCLLIEKPLPLIYFNQKRLLLSLLMNVITNIELGVFKNKYQKLLIIIKKILSFYFLYVSKDTEPSQYFKIMLEIFSAHICDTQPADEIEKKELYGLLIEFLNQLFLLKNQYGLEGCKSFLCNKKITDYFFIDSSEELEKLKNSLIAAKIGTIGTQAT